MKLSSRRLEEFREAIGPSGLGLTELAIYPGATRYSRRSAVVCRFDANGDGLIEEAAEKAGRLVSARFGIEMDWGARSEADNSISCWVEYFPGGADYAAALFTVQALQAAIVGIAAARSGEASQARVAEREAELAEKFPARDVFVQSKFLISAARNADIPFHNVAGTSIGWQFGWGSRSDMFFMTGSMADSVPGHQVTLRKGFTKKLFREIGLPTPDWRVLRDGDDGMRAVRTIGWPCVVKPVDQAFGIGVTANISTPADLSVALSEARKHSRNVMVEAHEAGHDHRLMVVDGRLIAAVSREPPFVTGEGNSSIGELLAELNRHRDGTRECGYLLPVVHDAALDATMASQGLTMESVLPDGSKFVLRSIANFSTGGFASDVTDKVHPQIRGLAELLAKSVGLRTAGIDYITTDISRSHAEVGGGFIEVNAMPRLRLLMGAGHSEEDIGRLLLGERPGRIPVTLIVGSSDVLAELTDPIRARTASVEGAAAVAATWAQVGATELPAAGLDPFARVSAAVRHLAVDELVILWSAAEVHEYGLPLDRFDRLIVVGGEIDESWTSGFSRDVVMADGASAALEAAFPRSEA